jgi:hypothetical protein
MLRPTSRPQPLLAPILNSRWLKPWEQIDWSLLLAVVLLTAIGGMFIRSTLLHSHMETDWKGDGGRGTDSGDGGGAQPL